MHASCATSIAASGLGDLIRPMESLCPCGINLCFGEMRFWISSMVASDPMAMTVLAEWKVWSSKSVTIVTCWDRGVGSWSIHSEISGSPEDGSFTRL